MAIMLEVIILVEFELIEFYSFGTITLVFNASNNVRDTYMLMCLSYI